VAATVTETVVMVAAAHAERVVEVVAEAEADIGENRGSSGGVDSDGGGNICVGGGGGDGGQQRRTTMVTAAKTGLQQRCCATKRVVITALRAMAMRVEGKQWRRQQCGQWRWR
jgi:hypothetical protein